MGAPGNPKDMVVLERRSSTPGISPEVSDHGTKTDFLKSPKLDALPSFPGDYELQTLTLTSPNREGYINLKAAWSDFNIYEDMFANSLTPNIQIVIM